MRKLKLQQLGLALCGLCLSFFSPIRPSFICLTFFGEPEFPQENV